MKFNCPHCAQSLDADPDMGGLKVECPTCSKQITVPMEPAPTPIAPPAGKQTTNGLAVASLILGILSVVPLGPLAGIPAIVCGHLSLRRIKRRFQPGRGLAISGLVLAYLSLAVFVWIGATIYTYSRNITVPGGLHQAAKEGRTEDATKVLARGADINEKKEFGTPLHYAASFGQPDMIGFLIDRGAYVDAWIDPIGTPLICAAGAGRKDCVEALLERGANVNATGASTMKATAMHHAALHGHTEVVEILLQHGADSDMRDLAGRTPLDAALFGQQQATADLLRRHLPATARPRTQTNTPSSEPEELVTDSEKQRMTELSMKGLFLLPESKRMRLLELYQKQLSPDSPEFEERLALAQESLEMLPLDDQQEFEQLSQRMAARSTAADYPEASDRLVGQDLQLFGGKVTLRLPRGFGRMPASMIAQKFQRGNPPKYVYSTEDGAISVSLDRFLMKPLPEGDVALADFREWIEMAYDLTVEGFNVVERGYMTIGGVKWVKQDLILPASDVDPEMRNIVLYTSFEGYPLMVQFTCPVANYSQTARELTQTMDSIRVQ